MTSLWMPASFEERNGRLGSGDFVGEEMECFSPTVPLKSFEVYLALVLFRCFDAETAGFRETCVCHALGDPGNTDLPFLPLEGGEVGASHEGLRLLVVVGQEEEEAGETPGITVCGNWEFGVFSGTERSIDADLVRAGMV